MKIKAIITACGYVETNRIASNLWCPYADSEEMTVNDAITKLAFDFLRTYQESATFDYFSEDDFKQYIINSCYGEINDCFWIDDEHTTFTPYNSFTELFFIEKFETIFIDSDFEKIILSFINEEMLKAVFGTDIKYDLNEFNYTNSKCIIYNQDDEYFKIEFDYKKLYEKK